MEMIIIIVAIVQSIAISLGVGCSTLAIINYFVAYADGRIVKNERKLMGVVYTVLRLAMIIILITTITLAIYNAGLGASNYFIPLTSGIWTLIAVLYLNSYLMTKHKMPQTIGPALQASTWYTLGVLMALIPLGLYHFSYIEFLVAYFAAIALAIALVNGILSYLKNQK
jgi:hypothetical protein